jgi:hypothetical protein
LHAYQKQVKKHPNTIISFVSTNDTLCGQEVKISGLWLSFTAESDLNLARGQNR